MFANVRQQRQVRQRFRDRTGQPEVVETQLAQLCRRIDVTPSSGSQRICSDLQRAAHQQQSTRHASLIGQSATASSLEHRNTVVVLNLAQGADLSRNVGQTVVSQPQHDQTAERGDGRGQI